MAERKTLLIPSLLDDWFPLLRYAFASERWEPVLLDGDWREAESLGMRHVHNDLCVPFVLITGQVLAALRSGMYEPGRTGVLISQAGDACRGSCLIRLLRKVLDREGFSQVPVSYTHLLDMLLGIKFGQKYYRFHVAGAGEHVHGAGPDGPVAQLAEPLHVPAQGGRVTGDIHHPVRRHPGDGVHHVGRQPLPGRVHHHHVGADALPDRKSVV